jgi:PAS domain S-box-containing protein
MNSIGAGWLDKAQTWKIERPQVAAGVEHPVFAELNNPAYERLLKTLPILLHGMDGSGRMTMANDAWLAAMGYAADEVVGRSFSEFMPPESRTKLITTIYPKYLVSGDCNSEQILLTRKDGSLATMRLTMLAYRGEKGRLQKSVCLLQDITKEKLAEIASSRSDQRFRGAFLNSVQGMAIVSPNGNIDIANIAICEMLKRTDADLASKTFDELVHRDDRGQFLNGMRQLLSGEVPSLQQELRYMSGDGKVVHGATSVALVRSEKGETEQLVVQLLDITERKLVTKRLQKAQKMEAIGQLTGGLAHDFNNLLTVIVGNMQLLDGKFGADEKSQKRLNEAIDAARRGSDLTRQLLAFARQQDLEPRDVSVNELVRGMEQMISRSIGEAVELHVATMDGDPRSLIDSSQLESAILNLAINARDAMQSQGKLTIETHPVYLDHHYAARNPDVSPGHYVLVAVTDTGSGMTPDIVEKAFQPFFTTKPAGKGTGLGLSMVYGFIKQSGGHISIYSEVGHGTAIKMYLPRRMRHGEAQGEVFGSPQPVAEDAAVISNERRPKILVVEDQEAVRAVACGFLEDFGYDVIEAGDGFEALAKLQENPDVDLMFSDVVMPGGMNGFDLAQAAQSMRPDLKVVHTSGYPKGAMVHQDEPRFKEGFIIMKPYRREDLQKIIKDALERQ